MALAPPQRCPQPPPYLCPQRCCRAGRDLLQNVTFQIFSPPPYLPPLGFVQTLITLPMFTQYALPWNQAGSMDKFTDQLNPWSGTWLSQARGAGAWECRAASMGACALIPSLSPLGWERHKDNKTLIPSLHTLSAARGAPCTPKPPLDQGVGAKKFPLILPKCLDLKSAQLVGHQCLLPPVAKAAWPKSCPSRRFW